MTTSDKKERVDVLLVRQGLVGSREKAQSLIIAGKVLAGDRLLDKPGIKIPENTELRIRGDVDKYVSRGAYKLKAALQSFGIELTNTVCLDIGASTGGFTQICLEAGANKVYALDVGHNQLDWKIRSDPRVVVIEGVNIRNVPAGTIAEKADFICIDCSFISLKLVLPHVQQFLKANKDVVALIKPQHEVGREQVGKGGIVKEPELHAAVTEAITAYAQSIGFQVLGLIESPIKGTTGNKEFLIHIRFS